MGFSKLQWSLCLLVFALITFGLCEELKERNEKDDILIRQRRASQTGGMQQCTCPCGSPGRPGRDGRDGRDATLIGPVGKQGKPGPPGPRGVKGESGGVTGGAVYTRWGRDVCPSNTKTSMLYSGVAGGSYYSHTGGASNYLCLPLNPIYDKVAPGVQGYSAIYGAEYESYQSNIFPTNVFNHEVPCAVCHVDSRGSHVMIPARNVCPTGWTMEYKGYLMTANSGHKGRTQYVCVDGEPTPTTRSKSPDNDGALFYFVESRCGSLPCLPYVDGNELTCVVCTK